MSQIVEKMRQEIMDRSARFEEQTKGTKDEYNIYREHIQYVYKYVVMLSKDKNVDREVLELAALLHDISMTDMALDRSRHNEYGAEIAEQLLRENNRNEYHEGFGETAEMKKVIADVGAHYDLLIEENNDPVRDPVVLQEYMDSWDGRRFLEMLELNPSKSVLEIGVGTGRLAVRTAPCCRHLTGIDISSKTIERARENLRGYPDISLICGDFLTHSFSETFDVIYSSLTMMHFSDKALVIGKMSSLLNDDGILCISIDKNQSEWIDMGNRKVRIYPDTPEEIVTIAGQAGLKTKRVLEIENAYLLAFAK